MLRQPGYNLATANVLYVAIFGTWLVVVTISILLGISYFFLHHSQVFGSLLLCAFAAAYIAIAHYCSRRYYYNVAAYLLAIFYFLLASGIAWNWGINTPMSPLMFVLVIILAGILLTARHALFAGALSVLSVLLLQTLATFNWHIPNTSWSNSQSNFGDVLGYSVVFSMLALMSWLYNREMERTLAHARYAEVALLQQRTTLRRQIKERTADLRRVQIEEMRQMYHFAELGQLGITLLHDLANHVTALTLELEGAQEKRYSKEMVRAQQITNYLSEIVDSTRQRLYGGTTEQTFDIIQKINETIDFLYSKAVHNDVDIEWQAGMQSCKYIGDPASFNQIAAIIINNAIDSYKNTSFSHKRRVVVALQLTEKLVIIRIGDWGKGITKTQRKQLFKPHHSTKKSGLGLGLYIAKQTAEMLFSGTITLAPQSDHTEFIIKLPRTDGK